MDPSAPERLEVVHSASRLASACEQRRQLDFSSHPAGSLGSDFVARRKLHIAVKTTTTTAHLSMCAVIILACRRAKRLAGWLLVSSRSRARFASKFKFKCELELELELFTSQSASSPGWLGRDANERSSVERAH